MIIRLYKQVTTPAVMAEGFAIPAKTTETLVWSSNEHSVFQFPDLLGFESGWLGAIRLVDVVQNGRVQEPYFIQDQNRDDLRLEVIDVDVIAETDRVPARNQYRRRGIIAAINPRGVIGKEGRIPWHVKDDLSHFRQMTHEKAIVMGRSTFNSIGGRPLPNRKNVVITSKPETLPILNLDEKNNLYGAVDFEAVDSIVKPLDTVLYIGGAAVYAKALDAGIGWMYLTHIPIEIDGGDTFFPSFDPTQWVLLGCVTLKCEHTPYPITLTCLCRKNAYVAGDDQ